MENTAILGKVKEHFCKERSVTLWGQSELFVPPLCGTALGNGRVLFCVKSQDSRPKFWYILVDSKVNDYFKEDAEDEILEEKIEYVENEIMLALEEYYGRAYISEYDETEDLSEDEIKQGFRDFPAFDFSGGSCWIECENIFEGIPELNGLEFI